MIMPTALEAIAIEKTLGSGAASVRALKGVSLALGAGQLTILMGPSGSGKSTLLAIMGCILTPTSGTVTVAGRSTAGLDTEQLAEVRRQHIGFVFQSYNLFPGLTALENVRAGLAIRKREARQSTDVARAALESVGLGHKLASLPRQLSGGEQQRVAIARAIAGDPSVVLADEPTAALDSVAGRNVMQQFQRLASEEGRAVLVVSHDARALPFADRIVTMEDGLVLNDQTSVACVQPSDAIAGAPVHG
jgi:putative ABC transport system ATP-binding protein